MVVTKGILGAQTKAQLEPLVRKNHCNSSPAAAAQEEFGIALSCRKPKAQGRRRSAQKHAS